MTPDQDNHLSKLIFRVGKRLQTKYRKGALEHGGYLWLMPAEELLENAIDEAIDQLTYLLTLKETLDNERNKHR